MTASEALEHLLSRTVENAERVFDDDAWMRSVEERADGLRARMRDAAGMYAPSETEMGRILLEAVDLDAEVRKAGG